MALFFFNNILLREHDENIKIMARIALDISELTPSISAKQSYKRQILTEPFP